jgi:hypothetical protein
MIAAEKGNLELVQLLLERNASVDAKTTARRIIIYSRRIRVG